MGEERTSVRLNPAKIPDDVAGMPVQALKRIPWTALGYYLDKRPSFTFDPLFHAGCYYVQEASSMLLEQALRQHARLSGPLKVLDLCAAPGGKSTHLHSLLPAGSLLLSNEAIRSRAGILKDNIVKWGCENVVVTSNDPADFSKLEEYFDLIVADAPCSGSGLFRRDPDTISEWSEKNVQLCSQRQQRILADSWPALKPGGLLLYSTCSYSPEEDEEIVRWMIRQFGALSRPLVFPPEWGIVESKDGYRCWPYKVMGEGFFLAVLQKPVSDAAETMFKRMQQEPLSGKETKAIGAWMNTEDRFLFRHRESVYAWPAALAADFSYLRQQLRVIYSGVYAGEWMRDKLVPSHALAMSGLLRTGTGRFTLERDNAIRYLQRKELSRGTIPAGWQVAEYAGHPLGWVNVLPGRVNNYYPKELRIRMEQPAE